MIKLYVKGSQGYIPKWLSKTHSGFIESLDTTTHSLLDVSDSIKNLYLEQAKRAPKALLLSLLISLMIVTSFQTAINKRLHVELALIRMTYVRTKEVSMADNSPTPSASDQKKKVTANPKPKQDEKTSQAQQENLDKEQISAQEGTHSTNPPPVDTQNPPQKESEVAVKPQQVQESKINTKPKKAPIKTNLLDALKEIIEDYNSVTKNTQPFNIENVNEVWQSYLDTITIKHIKSLLTTTSLYIKDDQSSVVTLYANQAELRMLF